MRCIRVRDSLLVCLLFAPIVAWSNVPDWVHTAQSKPAISYPADTKALVMLDESIATVTGPGEMEFSSRRVVRILRPEGRKEGTLKVYLGAADKLLGIHAWTIDQSGREYEIKDKEFIEVSPFRESLYTDIKFRAADAPAPNPGSIIAFEYTVRRHTFVDQMHWFVQEDIPVS